MRSGWTLVIVSGPGSSARRLAVTPTRLTLAAVACLGLAFAGMALGWAWGMVEAARIATPGTVAAQGPNERG